MDTTLEPSAEEKSGKSWQRRKQARPGEILEAALTVFAEKGFAAARMEDIASKAGVTKGTIYLYFQSKEEVFKSLARTHIADVLTVAAERARNFEGTFFEFLDLFFQGFACSIMTSEISALPKIIISEAGNFPELARFWRQEVIDKAISILAAVMAKAVKRGEIRDLPPEYVCRISIAPLLMSLIWRTTFAHTDTTPFNYAEFLALHRDVLLRGLRPEGSNA